MDIDARVRWLERENRRLKAVMSAGALAVLLLATMALTPRNQVQDVVQARRFELRDTDGRLAAVLRLVDTSEVNPFAEIFGEARKPAPGATLELFGEGDLTAVSLSGALDRAQLYLSRGSDTYIAGPDGVFLMRDTGPMASLTNRDRGVFLKVAGPNGYAVLGNTTTVNKRTGAETTYPASTLTLFDAEGNVRARLP